jgi:maleate isomerase
MADRLFRIGQIVPSSNVTMETELPRMFRAREGVAPERFTFHSSRMRMRNVTREELAAMDREAERCAVELADARLDALAYACLVAIMSAGHGYHRESETRLAKVAADNGMPAPVVTSAGALIEGLRTLGARKVAMIAPYLKPLTRLVADYIEAEGVEVVDALSLEIPDNVEVGRRDPKALVELLPRLKTANADAIVLSACVQMPSLAAVPVAEKRTGLPVVSAAVCTAFALLARLGLTTVVPDAGVLLSGRYAATTLATSRRSAG